MKKKTKEERRQKELIDLEGAYILHCNREFLKAAAKAEMESVGQVKIKNFLV